MSRLRENRRYLDLINNDFGYDIARGRKYNYSVVHVRGEATLDIVDAPQEIYGVVGAYPFQTTAQALEIVSTDADDKPADTGARTVLVTGLSGNWGILSEIVSLNGAAAVDLAGSYLRVNEVRVLTAGSTGENEGVLTLQLNGAGAKVATVAAGANRSGMAIYSVPDGYQGLITRWYASSGPLATQTGIMELSVKEYGYLWEAREHAAVSPAKDIQLFLREPIYLPPKSDVRVRATTIAVDATVFQAGFDIVLIKL